MNSGPEAGFDQVKFKIGDRRENGPLVGAEDRGEHKRPSLLLQIFFAIVTEHRSKRARICAKVDDLM